MPKIAAYAGADLPSSDGPPAKSDRVSRSNNRFDTQCVASQLESNQKLGVLRGLFGFGGASESWVPSPEGCLKVMVEHVGSHLQKQMRAARGPSHLLLLDEALGE